MNDEVHVHIYTDGGADKDKPVSGWGYHGYFYNLEPSKKGMGNTKYLATATGYKSKKDAGKLEQVAMLNFIDGWGFNKDLITNNQVELMAAIDALENLKGLSDKVTFKKITVHVDSTYVLDGITKYVKKWKANGWKKSNNEEIKNKELWVRLDLIRDFFDGCLEWKHVKGHSEDLGNDLADRLATLAKNLNIRTESALDSNMDLREANGYFKAEPTNSRLLSHSYWYFNEGIPLDKDELGHWYYCGTHAAKDDIEDLGQAINNASYSVVCLKEPSREIDLVTNFQNSYFRGSRSRSLPVIGLMSTVLGGKNSKNLKEFDNGYLKHHSPSGNVFGIDGVDYTYHYKEPRLAKRAFDALNELTLRLRRYKNNNLWVNEKTYCLNSMLVDSSGKKPKLCSKIPTTGGKLELSIKTLADKSKPVRLILGVDLPNRNSLSKLADLNLDVHLVTWELDGVIKYATVVDCEEGFGIWCNYYSCLIMI